MKRYEKIQRISIDGYKIFEYMNPKNIADTISKHNICENCPISNEDGNCSKGVDLLFKERYINVIKECSKHIENWLMGDVISGKRKNS